MKAKYILMAWIIVLMLISLTQIFNIPPRAEDIYPLYKSGYFSVLERECYLVRDSFLSIKSMSKPEFAWVYLLDVKKEYGSDVTVYDSKGLKVFAPGERTREHDPEVLKVIGPQWPQKKSFFMDGYYQTIIPVTGRDECVFCHKKEDRRFIIGAMWFKQRYDTSVYYSKERIMIFLFALIMLTVLLMFVLKWDPARRINKLFDKSNDITPGG
jgi:hypothetical protein